MLKFIRSVLVSVLFIIFGFGALFLRYCIFPFQKSKLESYKTLQKVWHGFISFIKVTKIIKIDIKDYEKIKNIKNSIIVSTHPSFIDIVILMSIIPNSTCFVAKKLAHNFFLKGIVKYLFILEENESDVWLSECEDKINQGLNIIIFPMGTRHRKNEFPKIRRGCAYIAQKTEKNIIILNMETSYDFLQTHQPFYEAGEKPVLYSIECVGEINTKEYLDKYKDEVTFRTEITKEIAKKIYKK